MIRIAPSLLAGNYLNLKESIDIAQEAGSDYLHYDVMDGKFVPNITFGQGVLKAVADYSRIPLDAHLMIEDPQRYIEEFAAAGAKIITVHAEATHHLQRLLSQIRACGCLAGVALNPATSPECLRYVMGDFDLALVMTVNPGFGGQKLLPQTVEKIKEVRRMLDEAGVNAMFEVDGGVSTRTAPMLVSAGANLLVAGSAFYGNENPKAFAAELKGLKV